MTRRVLILGGTTEARQLGERLAGRADLAVMVSLAGRTADIVEHAVPVRVGGFGGAEGLATYLRKEAIDVLIDATHPYADQISRNAIAAAAKAKVAFVALRRPAWLRRSGDRWTEVRDVDEAVRALGQSPRRAFLTLGRQEIAAFVAAPQHIYLIRSIDPVEPRLPLPSATYIVERGPFNPAVEKAVLVKYAIDVIVCRNSGGAAAYGKIEAARELGSEVVMLRRPILPDAPSVATVDEAVAWLYHAGTLATDRGV